MWCRVLLIIVALTCTFQREITTDTDDLLCVLILSGIRKDDLGVNLMKKLERHNVSVDELNNQKNIEYCLMDSTKKSDTNVTVSTTEITTTTNNLSENIKSLDSRVYDTILNPESEHTSTFENNTKLNISDLEYYNKTDRPISKLVDLWITYEKLIKDNGDNVTEESRNNKQLPIRHEKEAEIESQAIDLAFFHKMVETHVSLPHFTTTESGAAKQPIDIVSQQIMKFLKNRHNCQNERSDDRVSGQTQTEIPKAVKFIQKNIKLAGNTETLQENRYTNNDTNRSYNDKNIIDLWITINKTNDHSDVDKMTKKSELDMRIGQPVTTDKLDKYLTNSKPSNLDLINKILSYIASQQSTTTEITTSDTHVVSIHQLINKFLQNNNALQDKTLNLLQEHLQSDPNTKLYTDKFKQSHSHSNVLDHQTRVLHKSNLLENRLRHRSKTIAKGENSETKYIELLKEYIAKKSVKLSNEATAKDKHINILQEIIESLENKDTHLTIPKKSSHEEADDIILAGTNFNVSAESNDKLSKNNEMSSNNTRNESFLSFKSEMPLPTYSDEIKVYSEELDHIFDMFESYFATKPDITTKSILPKVSKEINTIAQKVRQYLERNSSSGKSLIRSDRGFKINKKITPKTTINNKKRFPTVTHRTSYMDITKQQGQQLRISDSIELIPKTARFNNDSQIVIPKNVNDSVPAIITESKQLQADVIKQITEKVKASVLKDLENLVPVKIETTIDTTTTSTTKYAASTTKQKRLHSTTGLPRVKKGKKSNNSKEKLGASNTSIAQIKTEMKDMAEFFELFQQYKNMKNGMTTPANLNNIPEHNQKPTNGDQVASHSIQPSLLPIHSDNNLQRMNMYNQHIYVNPYHDFQMPKPIMQQTRTAITNEIREVKDGNQMAMKHPAAIIQTDAFQVPLLAIPVSHSIIPLNQNIILTTQNPIEHFKHIYEHNLHTKKPVGAHEFETLRHRTERLSDRDFGTHGWSNTKHSSNTEMDRSYDTNEPSYHSIIDRAFRKRQKYTAHSRQFRDNHQTIPNSIRHNPRNRELSLVHRDFYKETLDTHSKGDVWDLIRPSPEHKYERFHEKLERPEQWPSETRVRQNIAPKEQRKVNVASRPQVSFNEFKEKKTLYGDEHFLNFLQRQKKVNDMLESILAQKSDRIRSIETPDTIG